MGPLKLSCTIAIVASCAASAVASPATAGPHDDVGTVSLTRTLSVSTSGAGSGVIHVEPVGLAPGSRDPVARPSDCEGACRMSYNAGALVRLVARPSPGSAFTGWSTSDAVTGRVLCRGTAECTVLLLDDQAVVARFVPVYTLDIVLWAVSAGGGHAPKGSIVSTPSGIDCRFVPQQSGDCSATYLEGTTVTLKAIPESDCCTYFGGFFGDCHATNSLQCTLVMDSDKTVGVAWGSGTCGARPDRLGPADCGGGSTGPSL